MLMPLLALALSLPASTADPAPFPRCPAAALALRTDGGHGDFDGMSHSGTRLIVRNASRRACAVDLLPALTFHDRRGHALPVVRRAPVGMHPGPVMVPLRLLPGETASTPLRWVSGPVYATNRCFDVARIGTAIGGGTVSTRAGGHLCAPGDAVADVEQPPLRLGTD